MSYKKVSKTIDKYQILCYTKSINNMNILSDTFLNKKGRIEHDLWIL